MEAFVVRGGRKLEGTIRVDGAKNAALPILAASVLTEETVVLQGVPMISDVRKMTDILTMLGCRIRRDGHTLTLDAGGLNRTEMPDALSKQIRSSIFLLGPILSRFRQATVTYPGGCEIGLRPIDLHLSGLRSLGVVIHEEGGVIHCDGGNMHSGEVHLDYPSVGATEYPDGGGAAAGNFCYPQRGARTGNRRFGELHQRNGRKRPRRGQRGHDD